ncbi:unnamed protein product [Cuscuta campestris]|uniref:Light-harvesting complex-like protein OHP2, chloroplastic n=1 Tax=Cuscuta campestris TaxID=132261 RepID=A0A484MF62_9ASTE|nr:unnamed protein product [Cuscuta campestris]
MSVASSSSFSSIKIPNSSSSYSTFTKFSTARPITVTVRSSQPEGPLRRPVAPVKPIPPRPPQPSPPPPDQPGSAAAEGRSVITFEFQRQKAKELQEYFKQRKAEEANQGPFFGFIGKNEISNGRWAMFGFAVGMLTEYATGSDFVDQVKILLSNFGLLDLE